MNKSIEEKIENRSDYELPFNRKLNLKNIEHASGLKMLRLTIREGKRFTIIDIDKKSAQDLASDILTWAKEE